MARDSTALSCSWQIKEEHCLEANPILFYIEKLVTCATTQSEHGKEFGDWVLNWHLASKIIISAS